MYQPKGMNCTQATALEFRILLRNNIYILAEKTLWRPKREVIPDNKPRGWRASVREQTQVTITADGLITNNRLNMDTPNHQPIKSRGKI